MRRGPVQRTVPGAAPTERDHTVPSGDSFVASWHEAGRALQSARRGAMLSATDADRAVPAAIGQARIVSFDVFDTLVTRSCAAPSDVFLFLKLESPFDALELSPDELHAHRQAAEHDVRRARFAASRRDGEVTLSEIHAALARRLNLPDGAPLAAAELAAERRLLRANPRVCCWLDHARRAGARVLAISDTWYSAAELHGLLTFAGIDIAPDDIITSADHRVTKQEGALFGIAKERIGADVSAWLHIGDHPVSDEQTPRRLGIATILHPFDGAHASSVTGASLAASVRTGLVAAARHRPERAAWRIGYRTLGPLMLGFAQWIGAQARTHAARRVVFLLRDGLLFERICRIAAVLPGDVEVSVLPSSRRAALLPALLTDPQWTLPQLLAGVGLRPIREYLDRLGVDSAQFRSSLARAGIADLDRLVDARLPADNALVQRLFTAPDVLRSLTAVAMRERDALLLALQRGGLRDATPSLVVDLGWNGTIQKALHRVVTAADRRAPAWHGCYLATWPGIVTGAPDGMHADGFLSHAGTPAHRQRALAVGRELLEVLCSSFEGSLLHFRGTDAHPVLAPYEFDDVHAATVRAVHDGAAAYAAEHVAVLSCERGVLTPDEALADWLRLTHTPTDEEARLLGALSHSDNVGSQTSRRLATFTAPASDCEGLIGDHAMAYWKQGLLAQRSAQGAALGAMLWFAEDDSPA